MAGHTSPDERAFRAEVGALRSAERRRAFPLVLHVGVPAGPRVQVDSPWPPGPGHDAGLRFDLAAALIDSAATDGATPVWAWLTRPGVPEPHDCDLEWLAAVVRAFEAYGVPLAGFRTVTRSGWLDVRTGERRSWTRLRTRGTAEPRG